MESVRVFGPVPERADQMEKTTTVPRSLRVCLVFLSLYIWHFSPGGLPKRKIDNKISSSTLICGLLLWQLV